MNCVDMNCKHCSCRRCYTHSSVLPDWILEIYCEKGQPVHIPFNDKGERVYCEFYEKREVKNGY